MQHPKEEGRSSDGGTGEARETKPDCAALQVLNKYYPPDFDPALIPRNKKPSAPPSSLLPLPHVSFPAPSCIHPLVPSPRHLTPGRVRRGQANRGAHHDPLHSLLHDVQGVYVQGEKVQLEKGDYPGSDIPRDPHAQVRIGGERSGAARDLHDREKPPCAARVLGTRGARLSRVCCLWCVVPVRTFL